MVITRLMGGLGNQLFQYAAGRALAQRLNTLLKLDRSFLDADTGGRYTKRDYELDVFCCRQEFASARDLALVERLKKNDVLSRFLKKINPAGIEGVEEKGFEYQPAIEKVSGDCYLNGFWQSEKYFLSIRETLLEEFALAVPLSAAAAEMKQQIESDENSVAVHFRRGDYVSLAAASQYHGLTGMDYYQNAVGLLQEKIKQPRFYIFSDDMAWVRENFRPANAVYIDGGKGYEDLDLMKRCRHNIIANSSFSWWGAWLNPSPSKTVIAPLRWLNDATKNTNDLIPATWIKS